MKYLFGFVCLSLNPSLDFLIDIEPSQTLLDLPTFTPS